MDDDEWRPSFCIFIDTHRKGKVPSVKDESGKPCLFDTRIEAEREIADNLIARLQEFLDGQRDFGDAMTVEEYVDEVDILPDGSFFDADDNHFGKPT